MFDLIGLNGVGVVTVERKGIAGLQEAISIGADIAEDDRTLAIEIYDADKRVVFSVIYCEEGAPWADREVAPECRSPHYTRLENITRRNS